jgi:hypothetical protein
MDDLKLNYRREFSRSWFHASLGLLTLGLGFASGEPLGLIAGVTLYALGWLYLPDLGFFRGQVDRKAEESLRAAAAAQSMQFMRYRDAQLAGLTVDRRMRYGELVQVCKDVERASVQESQQGGASAAATDGTQATRLHKLDELMWTYLRLLTIEQSLELFLETELKDDVPAAAVLAKEDIVRLVAEIDALNRSAQKAGLESRQRLLTSKQDKLDVLQKRLERAEQARQNLSLVVSEQERLDQQIRLLRADAIASKNAGGLSQRIDASIEQLDQTNRWLSQMDEFKDVVGGIPQTDVRIGYGSMPVDRVPPLPAASQRLPPTVHRARTKEPT